MNYDARSPIQSLITRMSHIIRQTTSLSDIEKNRGISAIVTVINKLANRDHTESFVNAHSFSESLDKIGSYIDLALKTFEEMQGSLLMDEQKAKFVFALSETYEMLGNYGAALANYAKAEMLLVGRQDFSLQGRIKYRMARIHTERGDWDTAIR